MARNCNKYTAQNFLLLSLLVLLLNGLLIFSSQAAPRKTDSQKVVSGKKIGFMGNAAMKRGIDYGFDRGYLAGKADRGANLEPNLGRHEDYNNPEKYYRIEFGSKHYFIRGYKGGFAGGYERAFGKKPKISVPGLGDEPKPSEGDTIRTSDDATISDAL